MVDKAVDIVRDKLPQLNDSSEVFLYQNVITAFSWFRIILYMAVYLGLFLLQVLQGDFLFMGVWQPMHIVMLCGFVSHFGLLEFSAGEKDARVTAAIALTVDSFLLAAVLYIVSVNHSLFIFLGLICVGLTGLLLGAKASIKIGLLISALFTMVYSLHSQFDPESLRGVWLINNTSLFIVAALGGYLGDQFRFVSEDLEFKKVEIQNLTDINETIVDNIPSGLLVIDSDYKIIRANRGSAKLFGDLSLESKNLAEIFQDLKLTIAGLRQSLKPNALERLELNYYNYKKEKMILETIVSQINKPGQDEKQFLCLLQNLTEIKNLEFSMQQKEKLAAVGQLAAGIAHEIRNPLASISGSVQLLASSLQTQTPEDKKLLAIVIKEIDRLNKLVTEFLDFVRPDIRIEDPININSLVKEVLEIVRLNDKLSKKVEHRTELRAQGLIFGHYDKLKQAILNIVINGYQATVDTLRPEIYVQSYDSEGSIILVIQDNGMGMTKDNLKRVFEPFHTTKPQGTGLGLAITHKIIESHGAEIKIESELGLGAKFIMIFPAKNSPDTDKVLIKKQA